MTVELLRHVARQVGEQKRNGFVQTAIEGLVLTTAREQLPFHKAFFKPSLCIVLPGAKQVEIGGETTEYRARQAFVVGANMTVNGSVIEACPAHPFYGMALALDLDILREVAARLSIAPDYPTQGPALFVLDLDLQLEDCLDRLLSLQLSPDSIPILRDSVMREISFWLLKGPCGGAFARIAMLPRKARGVAAATEYLHDNFTRPTTVPDLAAMAGISVSTFHDQFKAATGVTPLQYIKQLRLFEARRLMIEDNLNVARASYLVGYESTSQFSREYSRFFGVSPKRDVRSLQTSEASLPLRTWWHSWPPTARVPREPALLAAE